MSNVGWSDCRRCGRQQKGPPLQPDTDFELRIVSAHVGRPMDLVFSSPLELIAAAAVTFTVNATAQDGETTWFEGVLLLAYFV